VDRGRRVEIGYALSSEEGQPQDLVKSAQMAEAIGFPFCAGGEDKPRIGQLTVCWARSEEEAVRTAHRVWPNGGLDGQFKNELPRPMYIEQACKPVTPEMIKKEIVCGPDASRHLEGIAQFVKAGFDHVYVHQVGPDQEGFMRFYEREVLPEVESLAA